MIPGEILTPDGTIELGAGRARVVLVVENSGDRPVQVGSHYHFAAANPALSFDRAMMKEVLEAPCDEVAEPRCHCDDNGQAPHGDPAVTDGLGDHRHGQGPPVAAPLPAPPGRAGPRRGSGSPAAGDTFLPAGTSGEGGAGRDVIGMDRE